MRDFTLKTYRLLLEALKAQKYEFQSFAEFLQNPLEKTVVLRHDVDARKLNSLATAKLEAELGIRGTYYFRIVSQSYDKEVILDIHSLGHEIGYHYEDLTLAGGNHEQAIKLFTEHLAKLRQVVPITTICMHGSPLSRYDNRKIWEHYNYKDYGITGEPYLDVDFSRVLYLTDTGRRWDGEKVSIRDKVVKSEKLKTKSEADGGNGGMAERWSRDEVRVTRLRRGFGELERGEVGIGRKPVFARISADKRIRTTFELIQALEVGKLPDQLMITVHPQRWDDRVLPWTKELILQNFKNPIKRLITQ